MFVEGQMVRKYKRRQGVKEGVVAGSVKDKSMAGDVKAGVVCGGVASPLSH